MLGKDFGLGTADPYYFKFIPTQIELLDGQVQPESNFRFVVYKGVQKFDQCKNLVPAEFSDHKLQVNDVQLNFYLPNYLPNRRVEFVVKIMLGNGAEQSEIGSILIDTGKVVTGFKEEKINNFSENVVISNELKVQYELYIDKTKYNLDSTVKNLRGQSDTKKKENSIDVDTRKSSGIKNLTRSVDSQEFVQQSSQKPKPFSRKPDLTRSMDTRNEEPEQPVSSKIKRQVSETSSQKRAYTSHRKDETSSSKQSGARDAVKKLKNPSDRQQSVHVPISKNTAAIHYQTSELKSSRHQYEADREQKEKAAKAESQPDVKNVIKIAIFFILSLFMIYNAMTPSKKYNSKKRVKV